MYLTVTHYYQLLPVWPFSCLFPPVLAILIKTSRVGQGDPSKEQGAEEEVLGIEMEETMLSIFMNMPNEPHSYV